MLKIGVYMFRVKGGGGVKRVYLKTHSGANQYQASKSSGFADETAEGDGAEE